MVGLITRPLCLDQLTTTHNPKPKTKPKPTAVDIYAGERLRQQRLIMGLSQARLASAINVTFQQIQKYEKGVNRMSTGTLFHLAQALEVSFAYFVEDFEGDNGTEPKNIDRHLLDLKDWNVIALYVACKKVNPDMPKLVSHMLQLWLNK